MAKKTPFQKIQNLIQELNEVKTELDDFSEVIQLSTNDRVKAKMIGAKKRAEADVLYLENRIRGIVIREASLSKIIGLASELLS